MGKYHIKWCPGVELESSRAFSDYLCQMCMLVFCFLFSEESSSVGLALFPGVNCSSVVQLTIGEQIANARTS